MLIQIMSEHRILCIDKQCLVHYLNKKPFSIVIRKVYENQQFTYSLIQEGENNFLPVQGAGSHEKFDLFCRW